MRDINRSINIFILCLAIMVIISQSYIWNVLSLDEGTYLSVAMLMKKGWTIYKDVFESKPPLFHFINYLVYSLVGNRIHAARLFSIGAAALSAYIIYEIVCLNHKDRTGVIAAVMFSLAASLPIFDGFRILTEPFSTFFMVAIIYINELYLRKNDPRLLYLIGFLGSAHTFVRPTGVLFTGLLVTLSFVRWKSLNGVREIGQIAIGGLVIPFIFSLYFLSQGAFGDFIFWIFEPAQGFTNYVVTNIAAKLQWILQVAKSILPLLGLTLFSLTRREHKVNELNIAWMVFLPFVFLVSFLPGFPHYYYELLPAISIQAAIGFSGIVDVWRTRSRRFQSLVVVIFLILTGVSIMESSVFFNNYRDATDFPLALKVSYDIREHSMPHETVFIYETAWPKLGPSIYYLAERAPPIHNLFFFPWKMSDLEYQRIINTIQSSEPSLVVLVGPEPVIPEVLDIQETILINYSLIEEYEDNTGIYPHVEDDNIYIRIYKRGPD